MLQLGFVRFVTTFRVFPHHFIYSRVFLSEERSGEECQHGLTSRCHPSSCRIRCDMKLFFFFFFSHSYRRQKQQYHTDALYLLVNFIFVAFKVICRSSKKCIEKRSRWTDLWMMMDNLPYIVLHGVTETTS